MMSDSDLKAGLSGEVMSVLGALVPAMREGSSKASAALPGQERNWATLLGGSHAEDAVRHLRDRMEQTTLQALTIRRLSSKLAARLSPTPDTIFVVTVCGFRRPEGVVKSLLDTDTMVYAIRAAAGLSARVIVERVER